MGGMRKREQETGEEEQSNFGHVLLACARLYDELGQARLNETLGEELARPSVMRLVPHVTEAGIRPTELARRVDVSKQAVGQTLARLEERGLVEYRADPTDGRAVLVRMTARGRRSARQGLAALERVRAEVESRVGAGVVEETFAGLRVILSALESLAAE